MKVTYKGPTMTHLTLGHKVVSLKAGENEVADELVADLKKTPGWKKLEEAKMVECGGAPAKKAEPKKEEAKAEEPKKEEDKKPAADKAKGKKK